MDLSKALKHEYNSFDFNMSKRRASESVGSSVLNRREFLKATLAKIEDITDAGECLCRAVLLRNSFIAAKAMKPKQKSLERPTKTVKL